MAKIIQTADLTPESIQRMTTGEREYVYNGLDCCVTLEVLEELLPQLDNQSSATYAFARALQGPILDMSMRGLLVNRERRDKALAEYQKQIERLEAQVTRIVTEGVGHSVTNTAKTRWWRSPAQLKTLLYEVMDLPTVRKKNANGIMAPTVNREALEKLSLYFLAEPICAHILALRDIEKKRQFLVTEFDPDGRIRSNFNIAGTNTGRLASSMSDFGTGTNLQNVDRILRSVFMADPGMKFCNIDLEQGDSRNLGALCWEHFYTTHGPEFAGTYLNACESGDLHTTVSRMARPQLPWTDDPKANRALADTKYYRNDSYRDLDKKLGHGCLTEDHEVLTPNGWTPITEKPPVIMTWREGWSGFAPVSQWTDHSYTGTLQSFEGNSMSALMTHDHRVPYRADTRRGFLNVRPAELGPQTFMPLGNSYEGGHIVPHARLVAAIMADGEDCGTYSRFHLHKARKVQRLQMLCEMYGVEFIPQTHNKYKVGYSYRKKADAHMLDWSASALDDFLDEYKYWDGHKASTCVTLFSVDREHLDWIKTLGRLRGIGGNFQKVYRSGFGSEVYRLQQNNRQWANGASVTHKKLEVENVRVLCPTVETSFFYVRRNGKIFVTGNSNYLGQPVTMAKHARVPKHEVEIFQHNYFSAFACIPEYHNFVRRELRDHQSLTTLFGRRRFFFGRPNEDSTIREAVAYCPQSMTADEINTGMLNLWRSGKIQLLVQVHDSILFQYPEELEDEIVPWAIENLKVPMTLVGDRRFFVPAEAQIGWNWGKEDKDNPDGLKKWKGGDDRKRTEFPKTFFL